MDDYRPCVLCVLKASWFSNSKCRGVTISLGERPQHCRKHCTMNKLSQRWASDPSVGAISSLLSAQLIQQDCLEAQSLYEHLTFSVYNRQTGPSDTV